jgi:hypothetical protein
MVQLDEPADALGDGVAGFNVPYQLIIAVFPPGQIAGRAHQQAEGLAVMAGVQEDGTHAAVHGIPNTLRHLVGHFVVRHMTPPKEDIGIVQHFLGQTAFGIVQSYGTDKDLLVLDTCLDGTMDAVRIDGTDGFLLFFVTEFVKNRNFDHNKTPYFLTFGV